MIASWLLTVYNNLTYADLKAAVKFKYWMVGLWQGQ